MAQGSKQWSRAQVARRETRFAVNDERPLGRDDDRVQIEFDEFGYFLSNSGHQFDEGRQRLSIDGWSPAKTVKERSRSQRTDHCLTRPGVEWRYRERPITQDVGHHPTEPDHHDRTEVGIDRKANNRFDTRLRHGLNDRAAHLWSQSRRHLFVGSVHRARAHERGHHAADIGLVDEVARTCFQHDRKAQGLPRGGGLVSAEDRLGRKNGQPARTE